jgi:hypothetical protein
MKLDDQDLKQRIRDDKTPLLTANFVEDTLDKVGFNAARVQVAAAQATGHQAKLPWVSQFFSHRFASPLLVLAVAGVLLLKTSMHAEDEELHHIDTLSLSTLLVL